MTGGPVPYASSSTRSLLPGSEFRAKPLSPSQTLPHPVLYKEPHPRRFLRLSSLFRNPKVSAPGSSSLRRNSRRNRRRRSFFAVEIHRRWSISARVVFAIGTASSSASPCSLHLLPKITGPPFSFSSSNPAAAAVPIYNSGELPCRLCASRCAP